MIRRALVLRPEPGNARTARLFRDGGMEVRQLPMFAIRPVAWRAPDPARYDALLLTSANATCYAGPELRRLRHLPVVAVGDATARAAVAAGLAVRLTGTGDAAAAVAAARDTGLRRLIHLAGRDRVSPADVDAVTVYRSDLLPILPAALAGLPGEAILLHSARAARHVARLLQPEMAQRTIVAISPAVAAAAGCGWSRVLVAEKPNDHAMLAVVRAD